MENYFYLGLGVMGEKMTKCWIQYNYNYVREKLWSKRQEPFIYFQVYPMGVYS